MNPRRLFPHVGVVAAAALVAALLPATAANAAPPAPEVDTGYAAAPQRIPAVDSQLGVGAVATLEPARIDVVRGDGDAASALVRVTALEPAADTEVLVEGAVALHVDAATSASTTVLVPLAGDGTFALSATGDVHTRIEPIAYFGDAAAPGAVSAVSTPVTRTEDEGTALSTAGAPIGLVGLGDVPATGVRSVFVTADFHAPDGATRTVTLDGADLPVTDGTVVSTFVTPDADGGTLISGPNDVSVSLTVRGWVAEATQTDAADPANVQGSLVPAIDTRTQRVNVHDDAPASVDTTSVAPGNDALALVWAGPADQVTALAAGGDTTGRTTGAVIDRVSGAAPQLLLLDDTDPAVGVHRGEIAAHVRVIAGLTGVETPRASALDVTIESPEAGATIDLAEVGGTIDLAGTVAVTGGDLAAIEVTERGTVLGSPDVRYGTDGISWVFRTAAPESGTYEFIVTATDRSGARASSSVRVTIELPAKDETVIIDEVQILDDPSTIAVTALTDDTIVVICALEVGPGDYIVAGSIPGAPNGFLRRIIAVDVTDEGTVLHTEPAALTDVILQASADEETILGEGAVIEPVGLEDGWDVIDGDLPTVWLEDGEVDESGLHEVTEADKFVTGAAAASDAAVYRTAGVSTSDVVKALAAPTNAAARVGTELTSKTIKTAFAAAMPSMPGAGDLEDLSRTGRKKSSADFGATGGFGFELSAETTVKLAIGADITVEWSWGIPTAHADFETLFTLTSELEAAVEAFLEVSASAGHNFFKKTLAGINLPPITFPLGPVPVVVVPEITIGVTGEISASGSVDWTIERTFQKELGVSCDDGTCRKIDRTPKVSGDAQKVWGEPGLSVSASVEAGPTFGVAALLYDAAGAEISVGLLIGGEVSAKMTSTEITGEWDVYLALTAGLNLIVAVPVINVRVIEWEAAEVTFKVSLLSGEFFRIPWEAKPKTPPSGGSSASGSSGTKPTPGSGGGTGTTRDAIDVMFVIDTTGSMSGIISATLQKARDIAARLSSTARSARIGLVEFRDYGDDFMARTVQPLTEDLSTFGAGLDTLYADGGGDWEEAVYSGIVTALAEDWRPSAARTIIVMGDAPAHDPEYHTGYTGSQVAGFLSGATPLCQNGDTGIIGGPALPACVGGASFRTAPDSTITTASFSRPTARAAVTPMTTAAAGLPVMLFGISSDYTLTSQLSPLAEATGGTVADIYGSDAVGDAIDEALESAGAAPQPYFEWAPGTDDGTIAFDASGSLFEGDSATYAFDFGDGSASVTGADPVATHTFAAPGVYTVTLTVTDADGRTTSVEAAVEIAPDEPVWSAFTATATPDAVRPGESVTIAAAGLAPGERVTVAWDGISGVTSGVVSADGTLQATLPVPIAQAAGELGFTARAVDSRLIASGSITVTPLLVVCS